MLIRCEAIRIKIVIQILINIYVTKFVLDIKCWSGNHGNDEAYSYSMDHLVITLKFVRKVFVDSFSLLYIFFSTFSPFSSNFFYPSELKFTSWKLNLLTMAILICSSFSNPFPSSNCLKCIRRTTLSWRRIKVYRLVDFTSLVQVWWTFRSIRQLNCWPTFLVINQNDSVFNP